MGIIQTIKRWWDSLWQKEAQDKFGVETIESDVMKAALNDWVRSEEHTSELQSPR